jgi:hypothetical protein
VQKKGEKRRSEIKEKQIYIEINIHRHNDTHTQKQERKTFV